jgi:hypothetical protein
MMEAMVIMAERERVCIVSILSESPRETLQSRGMHIPGS